MLFAIRDDDTSFFTSPSELENAYSFVKEGCVSLSIVPHTVPYHKDSVFPYGKGFPYKEYAIKDNQELINYLITEHNNGKYEILLHGYSHEYKYINNKWVPELIWKEKERLDFEITNGKKELEQLLHCKINTFVAPNNAIDSKAIHACEMNRMNYSGIIQHCDREFSIRYLVNYVYRWGFRMIKRVAPGKCFDYGNHKEIYAFAPDSFERMKKEFDLCKMHNWPFVVYTHYWSLLENKNERELLERIYKYAIDNGAKLVPLSECFGMR